MPFLAQRRTEIKELMENPDCDQRKLHNTYRQFRAINTLVSGWGRIYRCHLRPSLRAAANAQGCATLLDIGFGGGDIPLRLARQARRDGIPLELTAVDQDPRALDYVRQFPTSSGIGFRDTSLSDLLARGERFDVVISNHLLHHLPESGLADFCDQTRQLGRRFVLHSDIVRSTFAYLAFAAFTSPFFHGSFIVPDGLMSIRRSFTHRELVDAAPSGWTVARAFPCHQLLIYRPQPVHKAKRTLAIFRR
jgi:2-polyprenyl-3-methyl-5-hydroxy-6-metoxy-1,4-benzoquinol methylase